MKKLIRRFAVWLYVKVVFLPTLKEVIEEEEKNHHYDIKLAEQESRYNTLQ